MLDRVNNTWTSASIRHTLALLLHTFNSEQTSLDWEHVGFNLTRSFLEISEYYLQWPIYY